MSQPAHFNDVTVVGTVEGLYRTPGGGLVEGVMLHVDTGEPARLAVLLPATTTRFQRGDLVWARGVLGSERLPGSPYHLVFLKPQHVEVLKKGR
jgi:hypothetical protein